MRKIETNLDGLFDTLNENALNGEVILFEGMIGWFTMECGKVVSKNIRYNTSSCIQPTLEVILV